MAVLSPDVMLADVKFEHVQRAFRATPDVNDYVPVDSVEQEIRRLLDAVVRGDGIAVLTAAPGAGKTVACRRLQSELSDQFEAVMLSSSEFATRRSLLQAILFELGQKYEGLTEQELRLTVLGRARRGADRRRIVLIVDEAHLLNPRLLEELRCLTNHADGGESLIRVVLSAQLALEDLLTQPALQALNYRITCHATLEPLSMQESAELVAGRLRNVGRSVEGIFTPDALETICRVSDGNPRCLVQICDHALTLADESDEVPVSADTVRLALRDLKQLPLQWNESAIDQLAEECDTSVPVASELDATDDDWLTDPDRAGDSTAGQQQDRQQPPPLTEMETIGGESRDAETTHWSSDVPTLEVGAEDDLATSEWSTFETQFEGDDESEAGPILVSESPDDAVTPQQPVAIADRDTADRSELTSADETDDRFVEIPVDDRYAALDVQTGHALDEPATMVDSLSSPCREAPPSVGRTSNSVRSELDEVSRTDLKVRPAKELPQATIDPQPRSGIRKNSDEVRIVNESEFLRIPLRLQTDERLAEFDVVEPQWEDEPVVDPLPTSPGRSDIKLVEADAPAATDRARAGSLPPRRPYARLFSRLRREQQDDAAGRVPSP